MFLAGALSPPFNRERERWHSQTMCQDCLVLKLRVRTLFYGLFSISSPWPLSKSLPFSVSLKLFPVLHKFTFFASFLNQFSLSLFIALDIILARKSFIGLCHLAYRLFTCPFQGLCPSPCPFPCVLFPAILRTVLFPIPFVPVLLSCSFPLSCLLFFPLFSPVFPLSFSHVLSPVLSLYPVLSPVLSLSPVLTPFLSAVTFPFSCLVFCSFPFPSLVSCSFPFPSLVSCSFPFPSLVFCLSRSPLLSLVLSLSPLLSTVLSPVLSLCSRWPYSLSFSPVPISPCPNLVTLPLKSLEWRKKS